MRSSGMRSGWWCWSLARELTCRRCWTRAPATRTGRAWSRSARTGTAAGVTTFTLRVQDYPARDDWDRALAAACAGFEPDLVVMAGFMKLVGADFLARFGGRVINTHPALLPSFPGMHGVRDALDYGAKVSGCTVFFIDAGTDSGPIIAQAAVPVQEDDDEAALHERIKVAERLLLVDTVGRLVRDGWSVQGRKVRIGS